MVSVRLLRLKAHVVRTATRFPFRYGIAAMTAAPHLFLRGEFEIGGKTVTGFAGEGLPPKWFVKSPDTTFDEDLPDMTAAIRSAVGIAIGLGERESFFDWWRALYREQDSWGRASSTPPLLAHLGTSLVERAGIDAVCRATGESFRDAVARNAFGIRLSDLHPELADTAPSDWLSKEGMIDDPTLLVRHTVGLSDPLTDEEIPEADRVSDGLPQSLEACVKAYGLRYFKIKLSGDAATDTARLKALATLLARESPEYRYTLDGNEQFREMGDFRTLWDSLRADPELADFLSSDHLIFVEQPLHRDVALDDEIGKAIADWPEAPPLVIDESDAEVGSLRRALELGYAGGSHKNCKGVTKGIVNACLLRQRAQAHPERAWIQSGEDLANTGPLALLQDLAVMHALGIRHIERNGHHYFAGLSPFDESIQKAVLANHGDLYRDAGSFPTLAIEDGRIEIGSVLAAPFGTGFPLDEVVAEWRSLEELERDGAFRGY
ncbi:MAG: hypothetical protein KDN19_11505 [Verrucomicrobiae bacterium]|nr:hypothetical protein [Verrucomicrobiae bacterium]